MGTEIKNRRTCHVAVLPFPIQGHLNPMFQFSTRLSSKSLKVTFLTTTFIDSLLQQKHHSNSISIETIDDGFNLGDNPLEYDRFYESNVPRSLTNLLVKYSTTPFPVSFLVYDSVLPWALDVVRKFGIDGAPFFTQSCSVTALLWHMKKGKAKVPLEEGCGLRLPGVPALEFRDLPSCVYDKSNPSRNELIFGQLSNIDEPKWLLWNSFEQVEEEATNWMSSKWPIKMVGPTIPSMHMDKRIIDDKHYGLSFFDPDTDTCIKWLDSKPRHSVIYVSFGSVASLQQDQMVELAFGLKETNINFLWVIRDQSHEENLPPSFLKEMSGIGLVVRWSPQLDVLAHTSVGCFVTHCGWNSTLEALSLGVPIVAMPQSFDQPTNAKFVTDTWKVGVRVKVDENGIVGKEELSRCIKQVMKGDRKDEYRKNSEKWKALATKAVDEDGSSDKNIDQFIEELISTANAIRK